MLLASVQVAAQEAVYVHCNGTNRSEEGGWLREASLRLTAESIDGWEPEFGWGPILCTPPSWSNSESVRRSREARSCVTTMGATYFEVTMTTSLYPDRREILRVDRRTGVYRFTQYASGSVRGWNEGICQPIENPETEISRRF